MSCSRRGFIQRLTVLGAAGVAAKPARASHAHPPDPNAMGVLVDITKCIGCRRCEFACQEAAGFDPPAMETFEDKSVFEQMRRPYPRSHTVINRFDRPTGSEPVYNKFNCLHCIHPACVSACLVGALEKRPDGPVVYHPHRCMGCRYCMVACPFEIPTYDYSTALTPEVRKCNLCSQLIPEKQEVPACVKICPAEVMTYGKRSELLAQAHRSIEEHPDVYINHVYGEHEAGGTSWIYIAGQSFQSLGLPDVGDGAPPDRTETIQHGVFKDFVPPVMLFGLLGAVMWLTKPGADRQDETEKHA